MSLQDIVALRTNISEFNSVYLGKNYLDQVTATNTKFLVLGLLAILSIVLTLYTRSHKNEILKTLGSLVDYYKTLYYFLVTKGPFKECPYFKENIQAQCHVYSLSLIFFLWDKPHYRSGTFQNDMLKNLRNVAIPGTGIPLSIFARYKFLAYWMILVGYPLTAFLAALNASQRSLSKCCRAFIEQLVEPQDWFSFWRLNCRLATAHAYITQNKWKNEYDVEDKWTFLIESEKKNIAVTPFMKVGRVVCKHRNEEGGLGYQSYKNASVGGDWIIQEKLNNGAFLQSMLPADAPLSTFRIISSSRGGIINSSLDEKKVVVIDDITALSCVWRAGRSKALTDHSAIMFNVDPNTGKKL